MKGAVRRCLYFLVPLTRKSRQISGDIIISSPFTWDTTLYPPVTYSDTVYYSKMISCNNLTTDKCLGLGRKTAQVWWKLSQRNDFWLTSKFHCKSIANHKSVRYFLSLTGFSQFMKICICLCILYLKCKYHELIQFGDCNLLNTWGWNGN